MTSWPRRAKIALAVGVFLWLSAFALLPGELAAAKKKTKPTARTHATAVLFVAAAALVLFGIPRLSSPPSLPASK